MAEPWWKSAVFYQIYPRSFADSDGDGVGDLAGIRAHLDHLQWLGVDALWICPFYPSPMADFGYDVADYCDVDPLFGTLADFDRLLEDAHGRGIRVIVDWVPNHTSDRHPWFVESRSSRHNRKRDWYIWRDRPNNWKAAFGGDAWTYDEATEQWYLHLFLPQQPDVNWRHPGLVEAMHDVLRFWLDRGVDGFRIDVAHGMVKDPSLPDDPPGSPAHSSINDCADTHPVLRQIRTLVDSYPGDRMLVGEVYLLDTTQVAAYFGTGDELHLAFDFTSLYAPWDPDAWRARFAAVRAEVEPVGGWPTWTLSNHDNVRHRSRYGGSEARARAAAVLVLTVRGTPFLYAGEELGLEDADVPPHRVVDPGGRDGCRAPVPWDGGPTHGWPVADPTSILHLYRRLLTARRASAALQVGAWSDWPSPPGALAYGREAGDDRRAVVVNFTAAPMTLPVDGDWTVEVASDGAGEGEPYPGTLGADQALILRP